ncbi:MAG: hypothetical protein LBH24_03720, partial [Clostridiales bacterium]|nr:hypothetical protein [Clostridiales bacterium]
DRQVKAVWTGVAREGGKTFLTGTITGVPNPDHVTAKAEIRIDVFDQLYPIASYTFEDANDLGKDSMGNHHLVKVGAGDITMGAHGAVFNGDAVLAEPAGEDRFTKDLTAFTISFDVTAASNSNWATPLGFGADASSNAEKWCYFQFGDNSGNGVSQLRFGAWHPAGAPPLGSAGETGYTQAVLRSDLVAETTYRVVLTADFKGEEGKIKIYIDGVATDYDRAANQFNISDDVFRFTLGGVLAGGQIRSLGKYNGQIDNVEIFDFEMNAMQAAVYSASGILKTNHAPAAYITAVGNTPTFADESEFDGIVHDKMTSAELLAALNPATVIAELNDNSTVELDVIWTQVDREDGNFVAKGKVAPVGLGLASIVLFSDIEIAQTLEDVQTAYDLSVSDGITGGTVTLEKQYALSGDTIVVTVTPDAGYAVASVSYGATPIAPDNGVYSFTVGNADVVVSAVFTAIQRSITIAAMTNGTVAASANSGIIGDTITLTVAPNVGYKVESICANNVEIVPSDGVYQITVQLSDIEITASFVYAPYSVTVAATENGTVTADKALAATGETVTLTVTPDAGYAVASVSYGATPIAPTDGAYSFTVGNADVVVSAVFTAIQRSITVAATTNGTVTASANSGIIGETITLTVTPDNRCKLKGVYVNGKAVEAEDGVYRFVMGTADVEITAEFEKEAGGCGQSGAAAAPGLLGMLGLLGAFAAVLRKKRGTHSIDQ